MSELTGGELVYLNTLAMQIDDIDALVNLAFPGTHAANSRLSFEQFCEWCEATPGITDVRFLISSCSPPLCWH